MAENNTYTPDRLDTIESRLRRLEERIERMRSQGISMIVPSAGTSSTSPGSPIRSLAQSRPARGAAPFARRMPGCLNGTEFFMDRIDSVATRKF